MYSRLLVVSIYLVQNMKKIIATFLLLIIIINTFVQSVFAGWVFYKNDGWNLEIYKNYVPDVGFVFNPIISYKDWTENLMINFNKNKSQDRSNIFWIVPIPSEKDKINVNIFEKDYFNKWWYNIDKKLRNDFISTILFTQITHIYSFFIYLSRISISDCSFDKWAWCLDPFFIEWTDNPNVIKYDIFSSTDIEWIEKYLKDKWIDNIQNLDNSIFEIYNDDSFSFLIVSFDKFDNNNENRYDEVTIHIDFPSDKIYYPLKSLDLYWDTEIDLFFRILDFIDIEKNDFIWSNSSWYYSVKLNEPIEMEWNYLHNKLNNNNLLGYTRIFLFKKLTQFENDLYLEKEHLETIDKIMFFEIITPIVVFLFYIFVSCIASLIAWILVFKYKMISKLKFLLFWFANFLTIIWFFILSRKYVNKFILDGKIWEYWDENAFKNKIKNYVILFSILFVTFVNVFYIPLFYILDSFLK